MYIALLIINSYHLIIAVIYKVGVIIVKIKYFDKGEDIKDAAIVRTEVFVNEQKFDADNEFDDIDNIAYHVVVYDDNDMPVATGRLFENEDIQDCYTVGRVAVLKQGRSSGLGRAVMLAIEEKAKSIGAKSLYLGAQDHAVGFYEKLGYVVSGDEYMDEHTPHYPMIKEL